MRIRQIRFKNINSFYGEHPPITFTDGILGQTGLFIIAGPTGSGKSTLLDIITLALFNRIPRISDTDGRGLSRDKIVAEGLIINQRAANEPKTEAYAEVEYELKGQAYRSRWSIEKNRNGNWNDYDMEVAQLPDGNLLSNKKRDVPSLNTEKIGLTYEQFIRSMVLAQGAFDKFLKASSGDRSKLLEQITGTDIYRRLSQGAHQQNKGYDERIKDKQREVTLIDFLSDERVAELNAEQKDIETRLGDLEKDVQFYRHEVTLVDAVTAADEELAKLERQQLSLDTRQQAFAPSAERLTRHEQVADLATAFADLANAESNRSQALRDRELAEGAVTELQIRLTALIDEVRELTQQPSVTEQSFDADLNAFRDKVLALTRQIEHEQERAAKPYQSIQHTLTTASQPWFRTLDLNDLEQVTLQVTSRCKETGVRLVQLENDYPMMTPERLQEEIGRYVEQEKQLSALIQLQEQQQQRLIEGMNLKAQINEKRDFLKINKPLLEQLAQKLDLLDKSRKDLEQQKFRLAQEANLEKLREGLVAGEPCPLCGSLDHPYVQHYVQQAGTLEVKLRLVTEDLSNKKQEHDTLHDSIIKAEADEQSLDQQRIQLRKVFASGKTTISEQLTELALDPTLELESLRDTQKLAEVQRGELVILQSLWEEEKALRRLADDLQIVRESSAALQQIISEKERLFASDDIQGRCNELTERFNTVKGELASQRGLAEHANKALADADQQINMLTSQLLPVLVERGLSDIDSARACLLDTPTLRQYQEIQKTLSDEALSISSRRDQATSKRKEAIEKRQTDLTGESVRQQVKDLEKEQRQRMEQLGNVKAQLSANDRDRKRQAKLAKELAKLEAEAMPWRELNRLIGSAKGDEYSRFAQSLTLAQLIGLANRRLRDLSDRYLLLKPRDGQDELYVLDQYQGNAERTVTSLSGGETFTLSLGLALALSDLASQNVQIDSLFVDEGFGTLDPDALDTAIVMLEKLQQDSHKTIGIISHRQEIKERISVQLQVEKGNDGNSRVAVVEL
ncbi:AAA family ATPase [Spirosoma taeanense]|uniref:AAA family ATPase n=1 Tax=Spirosoma taeanense TaxID=2735870 RepID=A0A6M5YEC9_9BACT|nr:AAA family ATPase [Spirosoma taeanense]QJW91964.1 AAA family ATPase [Spirosoma taeanense]